LQKNCHEFIAYENLVGVHPGARKTAGKTQPASTVQLASAMPLIRRALKVLSDREVSPQLGLLKSTLLQLDSTFSERDHGVSSFREFIQKLADAGHVNLKQVDRSLLVELKEVESRDSELAAVISTGEAPTPRAAEPAPVPASPPLDAIKGLLDILRGLKSKPHWPMYLRGFKQFLKALQPSFDEHAYGLSSIYDLVRQAQREGILRVERNRQGILRIFPGERFPEVGAEKSAEESGIDEPIIEQSEETLMELLQASEAMIPATEEEPLAVNEMQGELIVEAPVESELPEEPEPAREIVSSARKPAPRRRSRTLASGPKPARAARKARTTRKTASAPAKAAEPDIDVPF